MERAVTGAWHFAGALHGGTICRPALRFQGSNVRFLPLCRAKVSLE